MSHLRTVSHDLNAVIDFFGSDTNFAGTANIMKTKKEKKSKVSLRLRQFCTKSRKVEIFGKECVTIETKIIVSTIIDEKKKILHVFQHFQPASPTIFLQFKFLK